MNIVTNNLYWCVYKNLERELLALAEVIFINDAQLSVYSIKIANLLMNVAIEVEAISKELYFREGGTKLDDKDLFFDTDCLNLLNDKWALSKKVVMVTCPSLYLSNGGISLTPLHNAHKRGSSSSKWQQAYQAIKHNRAKELYQGNLKNLIHALAALYLLNIYYLNQTINLANHSNVSAFDASLGSSIFSIEVLPFKVLLPSWVYKKHVGLAQQCVYLIQGVEPTMSKLLNIMDEKYNDSMVNTSSQSSDKDYIIRSFKEKIPDFNKLYNCLQYEAVLNKNMLVQ